MDAHELVDQAQRILLFDGVEYYAGSPTGYRSRVDLVYFPGGLGMRSSYDSFIDVERSDLATERVNELITQARRLIDVDTFDQKTKRGALRYAVIRSLDTSCVSFVVNAKADLARIRGAINRFAATTDCENVLITFTEPDSDVSVASDYEVVKGSDVLEATLAGAKLCVHTQGFFQNNHEMAEVMHRFIGDCLEDVSGTLIDLYGGVGAFACSLGASFDQAIVIEEHDGAASIAAKNLAVNGIRGEAICADASVLASIDAHICTVITDPPRIGMSHKAILALARNRPERIIYVSCNPLIAPRDLAYLKGYVIERAAVFDLFPGTDHFEMVLSLRRR
jgi:tRNA/tmRNA/rRNA uracil-C5-methylase (TrmA/RlmC/RlmD family)